MSRLIFFSIEKSIAKITFLAYIFFSANNGAICDVTNGGDVIGQELIITLTRADGTVATVNGTNTFTFNPNPEVTCVKPRTTIEKWVLKLKLKLKDVSVNIEMGELVGSTSQISTGQAT